MTFLQLENLKEKENEMKKVQKLNKKFSRTFNGAKYESDEVVVNSTMAPNGDIVFSTDPPIQQTNVRQGVIVYDDLSAEDKEIYDTYVAMVDRLTADRVAEAFAKINEIKNERMP